MQAKDNENEDYIVSDFFHSISNNRPIPAKAKFLHEIEDFQHDHIINNKHIHKSHWVKKLNKTDGSPWLFREIPSELAEIEAYIAEVYRFLLGPERVPKYRSVYDGENIVGSISKEMPGIYNYVRFVCGYPNGQAPMQAVLDADLAAVLVASWFMQEHDLTFGNLVHNGSSQASRIDLEQSNIQLTIYNMPLGGSDAKSKQKLLKQRELYRKILQEVFAIHPNNINSFPFLGAPKFGKWPTVGIFAKRFAFDFYDLKKEPLFIRQQFKMMLKCSLLSEDILINMAEDYISDQQAIQEHIELNVSRASSLKNSLIKTRKFNKFVEENISEIKLIREEILAELELYNKEFSKAKYIHRRIDIDLMAQRFDAVIDESLEYAWLANEIKSIKIR